MVEKSVAIVILNYNSLEETRSLVKSIRIHERKCNPYIYIIDNASNDAALLKNEEYDKCKIILLKDNNGYAAGNNYGIRKAIEDGFDYIVIANSDTVIINDNTIYSLIMEMTRNNAHIIGPKILDKNRKESSGAGTVSIFGKVRDEFTKSITWCQCIIGAFFVLDKELIKNVGYINEKYFLYLEETDFFLNCFRMGYKTLYYPKISVIHYGGTTTSKVYDYYISRNRFMLAERNFNTPHLLVSMYLLFEYIITDIKQFVACKVGIRKYDYKFRRKMRWKGYIDGVKKIYGKKQKL